MAISPIELNGMISRTQDMQILNHNEEHKGMIDQQNFQGQFQQEIGHKLDQVRNADNAEKNPEKFDAKEKGKNEYAGDGGKKQRKQKEELDGKVIVRRMGNFDIKI